MRIVAFLLAAATIAAGSPVISEIYANPDVDSEFIELYNPGSAIDLTNWTISDAANNTFTFPNFTLAENSYVLVGIDFTWQIVWNNGGDTAYLRSANGTLVEEIVFGATEKGRSISRENHWREGEPTPGFASEVNGSDMTVTVQEVPPILSIDAPNRVKISSAVPVAIMVSDGNGDLTSWQLSAGSVLAAGSNATEETLSLTAPGAGAWNLQLTATDDYGHEITVLKTLQVATSDLIVDVSQLQFPALTPGATVESSNFTVEHAGWQSVVPVLDISDFTGPGNISASNLDIFWGEWIPYGGGIMQLPLLEPGEQVDVRFRLHVPEPLLAGTYGTSFTVTA
jgi:hypothetical protein